MLATAVSVVVIVLTLASATNLVLFCPPSPDITEIQDIRLCNGSTLSIKFNVSESCSNIKATLLLYFHHHDTSGGATAITDVTRKYSNYSDNKTLCGVTATLNDPVIINVDDFDHENLLQIRLREIFSDNEICSNNFHVFLDYTGFLGPPVDINSYSDNCSTINVTWSEPDVNCGNQPVNYNLSIYDDITDQFLWSVSVDNTSYQFKDDELFRHRYTYVISADNDFSEGISINDTFSYQRVPKSAMEHTTLDVLNYTQDMATVEYNIPVKIECTGEAPENATVIIQCNGTGVVYKDTTEVEYKQQPNNITGLISVPQYQQCNLRVIFSNSVGSSEPFILAFDTTPPLPPDITSSIPTVFVTSTLGPTYTSSLLPTVSATPTSGPGSDTPGSTTSIIVLLVLVLVSLLIIIVPVIVLILVLYLRRKKIKGLYKVSQVPEESGVPSELGTRVFSNAPMPNIDMGNSMAMQPMPKGPNSDNYEAADNSTTCRTFSETETTVVKTETNKEQGDIETPISYDIIAEEQKESMDMEGTTTTKAIGGGAAKEPIYSDLAPPTGSKSLQQTEVASVEYADIESVRPKLKGPPVQSYDDVVVSASGATVIGATGEDPPPIPDKKSKGAATTGQETNEETDPAQDSSHAHDDTIIDETQARTPTDITMVTGKENLTIIVKAPVQQTNPSPGSSSKNFLIPRRLSMPEGSFLSTAAVPTDSKPPAKSEDKESEMSNVSPTTEI